MYSLACRLSPILLVLSFLPRLPAQETRDWPYLGVTTEQITPGDPKSGIRVVYILSGSAAETIGLKLGDEIVALNDFLIYDRETFRNQLLREKPPSDTYGGSTLRFVVRRNGERLKIKGKIGSYRKTMTAYQEVIRKRMVGKPLPELPALKWWDPKTQTFEEKKDGFGHSKGKLTVLTAFDNCPRCTEYRYRKFVLTQQGLKKSGELPVAFVGIYQSDRQETQLGHEKLLANAKEMFEKISPPFPVAVAHYRDRPVTPVERNETHLYLHTHGVVILGPDGNVEYIQVYGIPEKEFGLAYQKLLTKYVVKKKK